jgi:hypothetical protein
MAETPGQSHEDRELRRATVLKGHGFSRADFEAQNVPALAAEGCFWHFKPLPQGLKPRTFLADLRHD